MTPEVNDQVPLDCPGAREIGFSIPARYNASRILFDNLAKGHGGKLALKGPAGQRSYAELCADAARWGHGFAALELRRRNGRYALATMCIGVGQGIAALLAAP